MGDLLKEIHLMFPKAANALKQAGFETDSDIQSLTREDMNELLPGAGDFRLRKDVLDKIQKSSQSTSSEILPHDNKDPPKNKNKIMGDLLKEIHLMSEEAADALTKAGFETDSDIRSLTREDMNALLPGAGDFKLRKDVFETIQKSSQSTSSEILPHDNKDPPKNKNKRSLSETREDHQQGEKGAVMGDLLKEIHLMFPKAADALKQAGFETDSDIRSLTREDLNELLPGAGDFRLRKDVLDKIQKSSQLKSSEILHNDNVNRLKNNNTWQDSKADKGAVMGDLLKEIHLMSEEAADALTNARFETDSDIQSLTRLDLHELFPGDGDLRLRKNVFDTIHKPRQANMPQKELEELHKNLATSAQIVPPSMVDLLKEIQRMSKEAAAVLTTAQIDPGVIKEKTCLIVDILLNMQDDSKADKGSLSTIEDHPQGAQEDWDTLEESQKSPSPAMDHSSDLDGSQDASRSKRKCNASRVSKTSGQNSQEVTVKYKMVVAGQTFGAHKQLMDQVKRATIGVEFLENSQDSQIVIVFCPITPRVESDVKAAMSGVPGDKPVILVKMHHVCESKSSLCLPTLIDDRNDVFQVNVFYHETFPGLLKCELNETAVFEIQQELLKHSDHRSKDTGPSISGQGSSDWKKRLDPRSWM